MSGVVIVPWYATGFRADAFEVALNEVAAVAMRYGAESYHVYRGPRRPLQVPAARRPSRTTSTGTATGAVPR